jgi:hypothetical protein
MDLGWIGKTVDVRSCLTLRFDRNLHNFGSNAIRLFPLAKLRERGHIVV